MVDFSCADQDPRSRKHLLKYKFIKPFLTGETQHNSTLESAPNDDSLFLAITLPAVFAWVPALTLKHTCSYSRVRANSSMAWKKAYKCTYKLESWKSEKSTLWQSELFNDEEWLLQLLQCLWNIQICRKNWLGVPFGAIWQRLGALTSRFGLPSHPNQSFQIPFDGKYVHWAYSSRMASLAGAVNDQWESPMLGSSQFNPGICMCIWETVFALVFGISSPKC